MRYFNGDFPPWRCSGRKRRRGERRHHPLGNKPWRTTSFDVNSAMEKRARKGTQRRRKRERVNGE